MTIWTSLIYSSVLLIVDPKPRYRYLFDEFNSDKIGDWNAESKYNPT